MKSLMTLAVLFIACLVVAEAAPRTRNVYTSSSCEGSSIVGTAYQANNFEPVLSTCTELGEGSGFYALDDATSAEPTSFPEGWSAVGISSSDTCNTYDTVFAGQIDTCYVYSYDGLYGYYSYKLTSCMDGEVVTFYQSADETCSNIQNTANYTATCTSHMAYLKVIVCGVPPAPVAPPVEPPVEEPVAAPQAVPQAQPVAPVAAPVRAPAKKNGSTMIGATESTLFVLSAVIVAMN